jgi:hypothetical protein
MRDIQPELERINKFWDKKTVFVHRRALLIVFFLGTVVGASFATIIIYITLS